MNIKLLASIFLCAMLAAPTVFGKGRFLGSFSRLFPAAKQVVNAKLGQAVGATGLSLMVACGLTGCGETSTHSMSDVGVSEACSNFDFTYLPTVGSRVAFLHGDGNILEGQVRKYYGEGIWVDTRWHGSVGLPVHSKLVMGVYSPNDSWVGAEVSFSGAHVSKPAYETIVAVIGSVYVDNDGNPTVYVLNPLYGIEHDGSEWIFDSVNAYVLQANTVNFLVAEESP